MVELPDTPLRPVEAGFLRTFYVDGLGEFAHRNGLDLTGLRIEAPVLDEPPVGPALGGATGGARSSPSAAASTPSCRWSWSGPCPTPPCSSWAGRATASPPSTARRR